MLNGKIQIKERCTTDFYYTVSSSVDDSHRPIQFFDPSWYWLLSSTWLILHSLPLVHLTCCPNRRGWACRSFWFCHCRFDFNRRTAGALPGCHWIVFTTRVICIKEFLKPLNEFKIILKSTFYQFFHWNYLWDERNTVSTACLLVQTPESFQADAAFPLSPTERKL